MLNSIIFLTLESLEHSVDGFSSFFDRPIFKLWSCNFLNSGTKNESSNKLVSDSILGWSRNNGSTLDQISFRFPVICVAAPFEWFNMSCNHICRSNLKTSKLSYMKRNSLSLILKRLQSVSVRWRHFGANDGFFKALGGNFSKNSLTFLLAGGQINLPFKYSSNGVSTWLLVTVASWVFMAINKSFSIPNLLWWSLICLSMSAIQIPQGRQIWKRMTKD